jgi:hypothetical protein
MMAKVNALREFQSHKGMVCASVEVLSVEIPVVYSHQTHYNFPRTDNKARQYDMVGNVDPYTTRRSQEAA